MPSMSKLISITLVTALLAGCGGRRAALLGPGADGVSGSSPPPSGTPGPIFTGDIPPSGSSTVIPTPTYTDRVPGACSLFTAGDVISVVHGTVKLDLQAGKETSGFDELSGAHSACRMDLTSTFPSTGGIDIIGGEVTVRIQSRGSDVYFPPRPDDTQVDNLGDQAIRRNGRLYVLVGTDVLTVEVGITSAGTVEESETRDFGWEKELAAMILARM
jgi:hypothetical protein